MCGRFASALKPLTESLVGGGAAPVGQTAQMPVVEGRAYELRCSQPVHVRSGSGGDVRATDLMVRPDTPLLFVADTALISVAAASADAVVWLREETLE